MNENATKKLCLALMGADSENEVINLLKNAGYWENPECWRYYGDYENNYNTIGNQQARSESALVEKLVNSVDARLMNECLAQGIDPESPNAPKSIQEAVARFFDNAPEGKTSLAGRIRDWSDAKRTNVARGITLTATGAKPGSGNLCFSIADAGEGQTPDQIPNTFLSLTKSIKMRIPFVQGKFNMGGTGVLKFCGENNIQLIVSRRNPAILKYQKGVLKDDTKWGFTVVRREFPQGNRRSSVYTYLAPLVDVSGSKSVLRFFAEALPIFPEGTKPYTREAEWGTLIKLYEYSATGFKSHILMKDGLLSRADLLLPEIALPIRFHECRNYQGHEGSFETTLTGVRIRLEDAKGKNLEDGFPVGAPMRVEGEEMLVSIFAFKKKGGEAYRKNEGIIFVVNGQTQGYLTQDFFSRKKVGLSYLADSILVIVDCTKLSNRAREDLFMNSRDRLSGGELRQQIEGSLEELLKQHQGLRDLREKRQREMIEAKLDDSKPLEDILENLLKHSPTLSNLFLKGLRASTPFKTVQAQEQEHKFKGRRFPTFFKFKGKDYGHIISRECHLNMRCRLTFETDAENEYFLRSSEPGEFSVSLVDDDGESSVPNFVPNLQNGIFTLSVSLPNDAAPGMQLKYITKTNDNSRIEPFTNEFHLTIKEALQVIDGGGNTRKPRKSPSEEKGEDRERTSGIKLPNIIPVEEKDWEDQSPPFDKFTAMRIVNTGNIEDGEEESASSLVYDFYINMDNLYLKSELKSSKVESNLLKAQFKYGMILVGLALLQDDIGKQQHLPASDEEVKGSNDNEVIIEKKVEEFCRAVAPVVIPMIDSLGSLSLDDGSVVGASGEAT